MNHLVVDLGRARERMVETQIAARGVRHPRVLEAMRAVPREAFVPDELAEFAYEDGPLPIGEGQTISQPYIVALMAELADPGPEDKVLEVGTGSGYAAAVMSRMAAQVYTIERHPELAETARRRLERPGYDNVESAAAMARSAGRKPRRSLPSWSPPAGPRCRMPCASSSRWAVGS